MPPIRVLARLLVAVMGQLGRCLFALFGVGALGYLYSNDLRLTGWVLLAVIILVLQLL